MEAAEPRSPLSRLDLGILLTLFFVGIAGVLGLIAVLDAGSRIGAVGKGVGVAFDTFESGATIALALACLARRRVDLLALAGLVVAGAALDLIVLEIWLGIESVTYGKIVLVAFVWSFFALIALGLSLATRQLDTLGRSLYGAAIGATLLGGAIVTVLIVSTGRGDIVPSASPIPVSGFGNDDLLRPLGVVLVLIATLWFAALAATRVDRVDPPS
jgi:hypothetical protein